jgi:hypothetical protein
MYIEFKLFKCKQAHVNAHSNASYKFMSLLPYLCAQILINPLTFIFLPLCQSSPPLSSFHYVCALLLPLCHCWRSLTTIINHQRNMKKGIYQPPNIELGFKLTGFHRFWWICVSAGVYEEKEARYQGRQGKKHIPLWNQVEKNLEDTRRWPTKGGPT